METELEHESWNGANILGVRWRGLRVAEEKGPGKGQQMCISPYPVAGPRQPLGRLGSPGELKGEDVCPARGLLNTSRLLFRTVRRGVGDFLGSCTLWGRSGGDRRTHKERDSYIIQQIRELVFFLLPIMILSEKCKLKSQ